MPRIKVQQRVKSPGELSEEKRTAQYWLAREAKQRPGTPPHKNTITFTPPKYRYDGWGTENV